MQSERRSLSRRHFLRMSAGVTTLALLAACTPTAPAGTAESGAAPAAGAAPTATPIPDRVAAEGREIVIEIQYPYGGVMVENMNQIWARYEETHPNVGIKAVWAANDLSTNQKLFTSIAAGTPPDVSWVDGPQVAEWAERSALEDLTAFVETAGLTEEDFWAPSWRQNQYKGSIWALTYTTDANFGFFWNKGVFADAGLDPEAPPTTIDELTAYNSQINIITDGNIERTGILPWTTYGTANSMFTWGWIFGGEFFDPDTNTITANHEANIAALEWMQQLANEVGGFEKVSGFQAGFGTGENHPFVVGKTSMALFGAWELANIFRFAPDVEYGITYAPAGPPPAEPRSSWVGGWCIGLPKGARQIDAAWDFIHWICATDEGASFHGELNRSTPGYKKASWYTKLETEVPEMVPFIDILREARHQRPVMPAQAYFMGALQRNVDAALLGEMTAEEALTAATEETQEELNKILERGFES